MIDSQYIFNIVVGIAGFLGAYVLNRISSTLDRIDEDIREFPKEYVSKEDYRKDIDEIKSMLNDIYRELRHKVDK